MAQPINPKDTQDRKVVADHLYKDRGPGEASARCDANAKFGSFDLADEMLQRLDLSPGLTVVDVGCGSGQHLVPYTAAVGESGTARGFDFSPKAIENSRARGVMADVADGGNLPLPDGYADRVSSAYSIYYLPDLHTAMVEWHRILKQGGKLVVCGPADDTNAELYDFHRKVTGEGPADVDTLSLGYVAERLPPELQGLGYTGIKTETLTNPIRFPSIDEFIDYWTSTSLFARGVPEDKREATIAAGRKELADRTDFTVTKRIAVVSATRA
ncbi:MAG: methyltransferase domain-containing protein [Planctomycetota bacterium]